jgi:hypothetical protein
MGVPESATSGSYAASKLQAPYLTIRGEVGVQLRIGWDKYLPSLHPTRLGQTAEPPSINRGDENK